MAAFTMFVALLGITVISPKAASAQQVPGPHPAYLHALSDLRLARAYLDQIAWPPVQRDEEHAIREIDAAINEIKRASIDDGKNLADHPPIDAHMRPDGRFRKALELLDKAHNDTARAEDVPQARGMRDRAIVHIDQAHGTVDDAILGFIGNSGTVCNRAFRGMTSLRLVCHPDFVTIFVSFSYCENCPESCFALRHPIISLIHAIQRIAFVH
jgi:hypothetical protein